MVITYNDNALEMFDKIIVDNVASWNAMIKGFGINHDGYMVVQC